MKLRHIWSVLWISTNWLVGRLWPVIDALALFSSHLFDLASIWNVCRELSTLSKRRMAFRSSRLAAAFVLGDLVFLSSFLQRFTYLLVWLSSWSISHYILSWLAIVQVSSSLWMKPSVWLQLWYAFQGIHWSEWISFDHIYDVTVEIRHIRRGPFLQRLTYFF
jgi:hypothetical protein